MRPPQRRAPSGQDGYARPRDCRISQSNPEESLYRRALPEWTTIRPPIQVDELTPHHWTKSKNDWRPLKLTPISQIGTLFDNMREKNTLL